MADRMVDNSPTAFRMLERTSTSPLLQSTLLSKNSGSTTPDQRDDNVDDEDELESLLQDYISSETDVDLLMEKLGRQLSTFETEMVVGILDSAVGVNEVVGQLTDREENHLTGVTAWIDYYNNQLQEMKKYIEHIESKNNKMNVVSNNQKELMKSLEYLLNLLTLDEATIRSLNNPDFNSPDGLTAAIKAATNLRKALTTKLKSGMEHMVAVKDQRKVFETYKVAFSRKVAMLIEREFKLSDASKDNNYDEDLPEHNVYFDSLGRYKPLVHWLKQLDIEKFHPLIPLYIKAYRSTYKHEIKPFFSSIQHSIQRESKDQNDFFSSHVKKAVEAATATPTKAPATPVSAKSLKKRTVDKAFRFGLSCVENAIMKEQLFLMDFFLFTDPPTEPKKQSQHQRQMSTGGGSSKQQPGALQSPGAPILPEGMDNPLNYILTEMFECAIPELKELVEKADQINPFYLLTMLIDTEQFISSHSVLGSSYSSFIVKILSDVQKTMKSLFNKFIDLQVDSIKSTQPALKRCGVLPHFKHFPIFVTSLEKYRTSADIESINSLINSSYFKVVVALNGWIDGLVEKQPSTDKYRFIAMVENYYYLTTKMEEIGVPCLKTYHETSQQRYKDNLKTYTNYLIDLRFKSLYEYFQKMDELLQTLPATDIQFQQSHSKQMFKKMVEKYKTENIEKGLIKALHDIYKHITKESKLILVIWEHLEEVFIEQYEHFQDLSQRCYQAAMPVSSDQIKGLFGSVLKKNPSKH
ncbi:hypothetical protein SAMD00019534_074330 [Acytostelium subglobosum LB1]|uniref:hypothetical protein n=1 Tax=Acytostelium subglobosum LB1 TaxID=1410327 RepID=UPI0006450CED|nr:hypothetical protein SAMD00019534_074330 [Acytostelium subglobosum LB1]GAM24258.1 hypothetical protein SAMD00019534_074330 [Acytostelium subglobosum LB1]|eukprot:XP_012752584.1 hypothetical protein SAMD00019534_074330 [Acytostelium subglobosum LB1]